MGKIKGKNKTVWLNSAAKIIPELVSILLAILSVVMQVDANPPCEHVIGKEIGLTRILEQLSLRELDSILFVNDDLECEVKDNKFQVSESGFAELLNAGCDAVKGVTLTWKFDDIDPEADILRGKPVQSESEMSVSPNSVAGAGKLIQRKVPLEFELLLPPVNRQHLSGEVEVGGEDLHGNYFRIGYDFVGKICKKDGRCFLNVRIHEKRKLNVKKAINERLFGQQ